MFVFASIFTTVIVQPIFNLLVLIYALLPGHNFGLAVVIFTIIIRLILWPLVKKQINQAKAMRELAPEIKKIKAAAKGDRRKESELTMELYKEREINPFASIGVIIVQIPILIGLYSGLRRIINDPHQIVTFSYPAIQHLAWIQTLSHNIHKFDDSLLGLINLTDKAVGTHGVYWAGIVLAILTAIVQYIQTRQLMPRDQNARSLRTIMREAGKGKTAEQSEVNAAVGRSTMVLMPAFVFIFALRLELALPLYWFVSSVVAVFQQYRLLRKDTSQADKATITTKIISEPEPKPESEPPRKVVKSGVTVTRRTLGKEDKPEGVGAKPKTKTAPKKRKNRRKRK